MKLRLVLVMTIAAKSVLSQIINYPGLTAYSSKFGNVLSTHTNVASLSALKRMSAGVYAEKRFLFKEFANCQLSIGLPISAGSICLAAAYAGDINLNSTELQVAYAKNLGRIQIGFSSGLHRTSMIGYDARTNLKVEVATIWHVSTKVFAGIQLTNPHQLFGNGSSPDLFPVYRFGLGYESSENLFVATELYKESGMTVSVRVSVRYEFAGKFFLSTGIMGATACPFFSAGLKWNQIKFEMHFGYHAQLGVSPGTAFIFEGLENERK